MKQQKIQKKKTHNYRKKKNTPPFFPTNKKHNKKNTAGHCTKQQNTEITSETRRHKPTTTQHPK